MLIRTTGLFAALLLWASSATAYLINPIITGADMAGMNVTAFYNGGSQSAIWGMTSANAGVPEGEGFAGAASGTGWSLSQQGYTEGNLSLINPGQVLGAWTLTNGTGFAITSVQIDALVAGIVFDNLFGSEGTPGSSTGREFLPESPSASAIYAAPFSAPDLFGSMTITFANGGLASGTSMRFLADTDAVVPEPATLFLFAVGLLGVLLARTRRPGVNDYQAVGQSS